MKKLLFALVLVATFLSCEKKEIEVDRTIFKQEALLEKIENWKSKKIKDCHEDALALAERRVDTLMAHLYSDPYDQKGIPRPPLKPDASSLDSFYLDDIKVEPIVQDSLSL